jgi:hypothetical protein
MGITSALFTVDIFQKIGLMYPASGQLVRDGIAHALDLQFRAEDLKNQVSWVERLPIIGFTIPGQKDIAETILGTTLTVDASGGDVVLKEAVHEAGESFQTLFRGEEGTKRLGALMKLLEAVPVA